ncbi:hypothetical protein PRIPAC_73460 [Pristionchus pacificus]|uniref:Uncharacterized protein n=1 Tax=Pristionchus pacificus TaxID=54126 RepID=A0A2A6CGS7_PRIPA|nr:hypothetical protein PRIPAC_73460 [Pristionchus pacificus]|eukprot:PDM77211.1 hypothetical protein PRIPAC_43123 [Pristionchus pacificus]
MDGMNKLRHEPFALPFSGIEILPRSDEMLKRRDCLAGFHLHRPSEEKNHEEYRCVVDISVSQ